MATLTDDDKQHFIDHGYVILRGAVPDDLILNTLSHTDPAYDQRAKPKPSQSTDTDTGAAPRHPRTLKRLKSDPVVTDLFFRSGLQSVAEQLLAPGKTVLRENFGQVAYTAPNRAEIDAGASLTDIHPNYSWHVDASHGRYAAIGADFLVLMGVALSDGQDVDENRGQFHFHPGSHLATHPALRDIIKAAPPPAEIVQRFRNSGLDVGPPQRALLKRGDVIVAHQRLAHSAGINLWSAVRKNVYFRVEHADFPVFVEKYVMADAPWVGFAGLAHLLPGGATDCAGAGFYDGLPTADDVDTDTAGDDAAAALDRLRRVLALKGVRDSLDDPELADKLTLTDDDRRAFMERGYVVLRGVIRKRFLDKARNKVRKADANGKILDHPSRKAVGSSAPHRMMKKHGKTSLMITGLLTRSGAVDCAEGLLGEGNVVLLNSTSDVVFAPPSDILIDEGRGSRDLEGAQWHVDLGSVRHKGKGLDHMVRAAVTITDGMDTDENRGQILVWPGGHLKTHPIIGEIVQNYGPFDQAKPFRQACKNLDVGEPERLLLAPGDLALIHQRLPTAFAPNMTDETGVIIQFSLQHVQMDDFVEEFNASDTPFYGFDGLKGLM